MTNERPRWLYDGDTFECEGLTFKFESEQDDIGPPWKEYDGTGDVRKTYNYYGHPEKRPGERLMHSDRGNHWLYDWTGAIEKAKKDGWGLGPEALDKLRAKLGREPTKGEIRAEAVQRDFDHLQGWISNQWHYQVLHITLVDDEDYDDYLGGVEDSEDRYVVETAFDMASEIAHRWKKEQQEKAFWAERDVVTK